MVAAAEKPVHKFHEFWINMEDFPGWLKLILFSVGNASFGEDLNQRLCADAELVYNHRTVILSVRIVNMEGLSGILCRIPMKKRNKPSWLVSVSGSLTKKGSK